MLFIIMQFSCSSKKNTAITRTYHSVNTRYNIYFNANEAYKEALAVKLKDQDENLTQIVNVFPDNSDTTKQQVSSNFTTTIDKCTKAIKLHSIKVKPRRDPARRGDQKYQAWLKQKEFTPFLDQTWLLLAKAEFQDKDYLRAITTFMYISKIYSSNPEIVAECQLWIARAYTEMGWLYESGNILHKMELAGGAPNKHKGLYSAVKANYLVRNKEYKEAIPYLELAIASEKDKLQKTRMKYLLGQLYADIGDKTKSYQAFGKVGGMGIPYKYSFNAQLRQIEVSNKTKAETINKLQKMGRQSKNKDYLDQIFYSIGNLYLQQNDTVKAIDNYRLSIKKSTRNGYDKAVTGITLGDIYFEQRRFVLAQPCYSDALSQLSKSHPDYPRVSLRSEVLDELVVHVKTLHEQDSLQYLVRLPEDERLEIINKRIADLKKEEAAQKKEADLQKQKDERNERISSWNDIERQNLFNDQNPGSGINMQALTPQQGDASLFYFYNEQTVNQGKIAFQKQWGNRKLEDDWRRKDKAVSLSNDIDEDVDTDTDEPLIAQTDEPEETKSHEEDIYSPQYYLQQLPFSESALKESDDLIENALFNMGKIYKNKLENLDLAIDAFTTDIRRFPQTPNLEEIYYQLFLIYMQLGDAEMMAMYRNRIIGEFSDGIYATPLSSPDYEWNFKHMASLQDSLYEATYQAYQKADVNTVRHNYESIQSKYPFGDLMPKFAFLNALSYAQTRDVTNLTSNLKNLIEKYPKSDVIPLATTILDHIKDGQVLLSDGSPLGGIDWSKAFKLAENGDDEDKIIAYSDSLDMPYVLLLMFEKNTIDRNELLFQVADYNFSNYVIQTFDLVYESKADTDILQIKGFEKFANIKSYLNRAFGEDGLFHHIDTTIMAVPISVENYTEILPILGMEEYQKFFTEHFNTQLPNLIAYWQTRTIPQGAEIIEDEDNESESVEEPISEDSQHTDIENIEKQVDKNQQEDAHKKPESEDKRDINAEDILSKEQVEIVGKANDVVEDIEKIVNNPVDGIKSIFSKKPAKEKLSKEEKAALKEEQRLEKQRAKELKAAEKAKSDSINKVEKAVQDSIKQVEQNRIDRIKADEKARQEEINAKNKAKEEARKQKIGERKEKIRQQEARRKEKEKERKEKLKAREEERKQREKQAKELRKQKEKAAQEKRDRKG